MKPTLFVANWMLAAAFLATAQKTPESMLGAALHQEEVQGDLKGAIATYQKVLATPGVSRKTAAEALVRMGECYEKLGDAESRKAYERVVREYADQNEAATEARSRLAAISGGAKTTEMANRRVWADAEDTEGGVSSDGRYLSYVDWTTGDLAIRNLPNKENRHLTHKGSWSESEEFALFSVISPDNKQVAFTWFNKDTNSDLRVISLDGANPRVLYRNPETAEPRPLAWSADGRHILALIGRKDRTNQIAIISAVDGSVRVLKTLDWRAPGGMAFSPDGRYIAYDFPPQEESPNRDVFILATDGTRETALVRDRSNDSLLGWTPDGKSILFASDRSGTIDAWAVEVADGRPQGDPQLVKTDIGEVRPMGFTKKGDFFYGVGKGLGGSIYTATIDPATRKPTSSPIRIAQRYVGSNYAPAWSPDGRFLAYLSNRSAGLSPSRVLTLVIQSTESGEEREIPLKFSYIPNFRWSPDGHSILFSGVDRKGKQGIIKLNTETGAATEIVQLVDSSYGGAHRPELTPDGNMLVFQRFQGGLTHTSIVLRDLASGEETSVVSENGPIRVVGSHALSPDGQKIAFDVSDKNARSSSLYVRPTTGGQAHEILVVHEPEGLGSIDWTPDGHELVFQKPNQKAMDSRRKLWAIPAEGGQPHALEGFGYLHPNGQQIVWGEGPRQPPEVWVMENFLPKLIAAK